MIDGSFDRSRREERRATAFERRAKKAAKRASQQSRTRPRDLTNFAVVLPAVHTAMHVRAAGAHSNTYELMRAMHSMSTLEKRSATRSTAAGGAARP